MRWGFPEGKDGEDSAPQWIFFGSSARTEVGAGLFEPAAATPAGVVARFIPALSIIDFFDRGFDDVIDLRTAVEISACFG